MNPKMYLLSVSSQSYIICLHQFTTLLLGQVVPTNRPPRTLGKALASVPTSLRMSTLGDRLLL